MKKLIGAAIIALAFTSTAHAYDYFASDHCGSDKVYAVKKPAGTPSRDGYYTKSQIQGSWTSANIKVENTPSKSKKQLQFFDTFKD